MKMRMTKEHRLWRRRSGMAKFERSCRNVQFESHTCKAYRVLGTQEAGDYAMFKARLCEDAQNNGWELYEVNHRASHIVFLTLRKLETTPYEVNHEQD